MKLLVLVFKRYKLNAVLASSHLVRPIANLLKRISMFFLHTNTLYWLFYSFLAFTVQMASPRKTLQL